MNKNIALVLVTLGYLNITNAADRMIEGTISGYGCGDNCYLTIVDANNKEHTGLCTASLCQKWNEDVDMPVEFKGKKVKVTVGKGVQYDGGDNVMGEMDAFDKIELLNLQFIYFAADAPPTANAPSEAPLCYKFQVASLEEQLGKIKVKYPNFYDEQLSNNADGSRSLIAKRKDEQGKEIKYFYSSSPTLCNQYQQQRLSLTAQSTPPKSASSPASTTSQTIAQSVLNKVYSGYDKKHQCWLVVDNEQRYCMKIDKIDSVSTEIGDRLYVLVTGVAVNNEGESDTNHAILGLVGGFVIEQRNNRSEIIAGHPKISAGSSGTGPTEWQFVKLGPLDYWGWQNTWGDCHQGYCGTRYSILAPHNKTIKDLAGIIASFTDEGHCVDEKCNSTTIDSNLEIDATQINEKVFPLMITVSGTNEGKKLTPKTWTIPFDTKKWSYVEPKDWPLKDREF